MRTRKHARKLRQLKKSRRSRFLQRGGSGKGVGGEDCRVTTFGGDNCLPGLACSKEKRCEPNFFLANFISDILQDPDMDEYDIPKALRSYTHLMNVPINSNGNTLLLESVTAKTHPDVVREVLKHVRDVNAKNKNGVTALIKAAQNNLPHLVQVILESGRADVNAKQIEDFNALHMTAADMQHWSSKVDFTEYRENHEKRKKTVRMLLEAGINVDAQTNSANTCLHYFVIPLTSGIPIEEARSRLHEQAEMVQMVLEKKANVNIQNSRGDTPLHVAYENPAVVKLLLDANANANLQDKSGNIPLHYAGHNPAVVKLLLAAGSNTAIVNKKGETPLAKFTGEADTNPESIALLSDTEENL